MIGFLILPHEIESFFECRMLGPQAQLTDHFHHAGGDIGGAGVNHRIVIGEWNSRQNLAVIVPIKRGPATVLVLHGQHPANTALHGIQDRTGGL